MRLVIVNHHPDCVFYIHEAFKKLGFDVVVASEKLTREITPDKSSSVVNNLWNVAENFFPPEKWGIYPKYTDHLYKNDLLYTIHGYCANNPKLSDIKIIMDIRNYHWIKDYGPNVIKVIGNLEVAKKLNYYYLTNFVRPLQIRSNPKYLSVIQSEWAAPLCKSIISEMGDLAFISGSNSSPKGFIWDDTLLEETQLMCVDKHNSIFSYSPAKALSKGIPVFTTKQCYLSEGYTSIPEEVFLFHNNFSVKDAYDIARSMPPESVKHTYEKVHNIDNCCRDLTLILERCL